MRIPYATLLLALLILIPYFYYAGGTLYLSNSFINSLALAEGHSGGLVTHLFVHVGVSHLIGNLFPLLAFAYLVELAAGAFTVLAIFFVAGVFSGLFFSVLNPSYYLVGASAAISGLMSAATVLKPKKALVLLVAVPLLLSFALFPLVAAFSESQTTSLVEQRTVLEKNLTELVKQNKTAEAAQVRESLVSLSGRIKQAEEGKLREQTTPTDFLVHAFGAVLGVLYLFTFKRELLRGGVAELEELGQRLSELRLPR